MKRNLLLALCILLAAAAFPLQAQIRGFRQTELKEWEFSRNGASWDSVSVPHVMPSTEGKYRCRFSVRNPKAPAYLYFEGAAQTAVIRINGEQVAFHQGGFTGFYVRLADYLSDGENLLEVDCSSAEDTEMAPVRAPFTLRGGLTGPVWLSQMEQAYFSPEAFGMYRVRCEIPELTDRKVVTNIKARIMNDSGRDVTVKIRMQMLDEEGRLAYQADRKVDMVAYDEYHFEHDFALAGIHRWDGERDPFLYTIRMELFEGNRMLDIAETKIGYRTVELDRERGLLLNGRPCPLRGVSLSPDDATASEASVRSIFADAVGRGANFVHMPYFPWNDAAFRQADSLGVIVMSQVPWLSVCGDRARQTYFNNVHDQMEEMLHNLYNHPSVVFWGMWNGVDETGNEGAPQGRFSAEKAVEQTRKLYELGKEIDPGRFFGVTDFSMLRPEGYTSLQTDFVVEGFREGSGLFPAFLKEVDSLRGKIRVPVGIWSEEADAEGGSHLLFKSVPLN